MKQQAPHQSKFDDRQKQQIITTTRFGNACRSSSTFMSTFGYLKKGYLFLLILAILLNLAFYCVLWKDLPFVQWQQAAQENDALGNVIPMEHLLNFENSYNSKNNKFTTNNDNPTFPDATPIVTIRRGHDRVQQRPKDETTNNDNNNDNNRTHSITSYMNSDYWKRRRDQLQKVFRQVIDKDTAATVLHAIPSHQVKTTEGTSATTTTTTTTTTVTTDGNSITVTTFLGVNKLHRFAYMTQRWGGPVSAAIYISNRNQLQQLLDFYESPETQIKYPDFYNLADMHLYLEPNDELGFPYNILRQLALDAIKTDYFLTLDVDLVTSPNAARGLHQLLFSSKQQHGHTITSLLQNNTVMALPAFQRTASVTNRDIVHVADQVLPNNKQQVVQQLQNHTIEIFHDDEPKFQGMTNYTKWLSQTTTTTTKTMTNKNNNDNDSSPYYFVDFKHSYEPYILAYKKRPSTTHKNSLDNDSYDDTDPLPDYWFDFRGSGHSKVSWVTDLYFSHYQFAILKDWFLIHLEHKSNKSVQMPKLYKRIMRFRTNLKQRLGWDDEMFAMVFSKYYYHSNDNDEKDDEHQDDNNPGKNGNVIATKLSSCFLQDHSNGTLTPAAKRDIPVFAPWRHHKGRVFGRVYTADDLLDDEPPEFNFLGTAVIAQGLIQANQTVTSMSGHSYYLCGDEMQIRGKVSPKLTIQNKK